MGWNHRRRAAMISTGEFASILTGTPPPVRAAEPGAGGGAAGSAAQAVAGIRYAAVPFAALPGWRDDDHSAAFKAFRRSCLAVLKRSTHPASGSADPVLRALAATCAHAQARGNRRISSRESRAFFERFFVPHRVVHTHASGLLTGYYEPHIDGSLVHTARFQVPVFGRPPDLENVVPEEARAAGGIAYTHMRRTAAGLAPYPTRTEIEAGALAGQGLEVVWLADPVEVFFAQVQGSARIRLPDGRRIGLAYDGKNGHPYTSIGRVLIDRGAMTPDEMSMASLGRFLRADIERGREVMQQNASYVFFRAMAGDEEPGAQGALGVALTTGRSLAVDTAFHRLGSPVFVDAPALRHGGQRQPFRRLMVAQDVGSAIRGPERGDIYFGSGEMAAARAGITKHAGQFYVLLPRVAVLTPAPRGGAVER